MTDIGITNTPIAAQVVSTTGDVVDAVIQQVTSLTLITNTTTTAQIVPATGVTAQVVATTGDVVDAVIQQGTPITVSIASVGMQGPPGIPGTAGTTESGLTYRPLT